ncbi:MAG: hypothetical protein ACRBCJ_02115 [Hyphomicrobiaceae bacterium]
MEYLILQTALWMLAAYFLGAMTACFVRRIFFKPTAREAVESNADWQVTPLKPAPVSAGAPVIEVGDQAVPASVNTDAKRFERALSEAPQGYSSPSMTPPQNEPQSISDQMQDIETPMHRDEASSQSASSTTTVQASSAPEPVAEPEFLPPADRTNSTPATQAAQQAPASDPSEASSAEASDTVQSTASQTEPVVEDKVESGDDNPVEPVRIGVPQDLRRIRSIDQSIATGLNNKGIYRYEHFTKLDNDDIGQLEKELEISGRFAAESWVAQAEILSKGNETSYTRGRGGHGSRKDLWATKIDSRSLLTVAQELKDEEADTAPQPKRTGAQQAVVAAAAVAAATAAANRTSGVLERSNRTTDAKDGAKEKDIATTPTSPNPTAPAELRPAKLSDAILDKTGKVSGFEERPDTATSMAVLKSVKSESLRGKEDYTGDEDDLKRIRGIGVLVEKKLNSIGVKSFVQIANWDKEDIKRVSGLLDFQGRIEREHWIEQARLLAS